MTKKQDKSGSKQSNKLETWGNEVTMNLNNILYQNIQASPYFKQLYELKTYHEVIDEIYNHVESLEPFLKGTTASTAFCLLYKLWTLRLTVKQVSGLIDHTDSPHIRALGFLYLRYVCKPANLWEWFEAYLDDEEELQVQGGPRPIIMTIGKMCIQLLTEQKWLGTILPRIPVPIARDIDQKLKEISSQKLPPPSLPPPSLSRRDSYDLEPRSSDRTTSSRHGGEDDEREYGGSRRSRTRSRSIEHVGGSSRSHRHRDYDYYYSHDYDRGRRDYDNGRYRGDRDSRDSERERKRSRSSSRDRHHHHKRHRSTSRDNRDHDSGRRSSGHDHNKRRYDDERGHERRRSKSPKS